MQLQIESVNWTLIVSLIVGSGILAYLGDVLGFKYGKQRISLFGLRPKYTSRLITAFTGAFISVAVLTALSFFSESVRIAILHMKYIQQQLETLQIQAIDSRAALEEAQQELISAQEQYHASRARLMEQESLLQTTAVSLDMVRFDFETLRNDRDVLLSEKNDLSSSVISLREESAELKRELDVMRLETITVQANSLLAQRVLEPNVSRERVRETLNLLETDVRTSIAEKLSEKRYVASGDLTASFDPIEESDVVASVTNVPERLYVRALAAENIALGENVRIRLEWGRSYLLYNAGETLHRKLVDPNDRPFNAEETLHLFLRELKIQAIENGVLPDPATNSVGSLEGEDFFEAVDRLKAISAPTILNAVALQDVYTEGPIRIRIELQE